MGDLRIDNKNFTSPFGLGPVHEKTNPAAVDQGSVKGVHASEEEELAAVQEQSRKPVYTGEHQGLLQKQQHEAEVAQDLSIEALNGLSKAQKAVAQSQAAQDPDEKLAFANEALQHIAQMPATDPEALSRGVGILESLRLGLPDNPMASSLDEQIRDLQKAIKEDLEAHLEKMDGAIEELPEHLKADVMERMPAAAQKKVGDMHQMMGLFREKLGAVEGAMNKRNAQWKQDLEVTKAFQHYQTLIGEYANEKEFDYSDRAQFPVLNELHDKMEASGIFTWKKRGWTNVEGQNYKSLNTNVGLAQQIAMATNKQDEIDASQLMNMYQTSVMWQSTVMKMIADITKHIIRSMAG